MKDNFSTNSDAYAKFRPEYPAAMFDFLYGLVQKNECAWDCGTGNGQVANVLARNFERVMATDLSLQQIQHATLHPNIVYKTEQAEHSTFAENSFDLITVAQAIHWFDFNAFYKEVIRTAKPGCILAVIGYGLFRIFPEAEKIIHRFYQDITGPYWDAERKYLDEEYKTIPFPFQELPHPEYSIEVEWDFERLMGFLSTWSAVKHFKEAKNFDPLDLISDDLRDCMEVGRLYSIRFPIFLRIARIEK